MKKNKKIMRKILFGVAIIYVTFTIYNQQKTLN